MSKSVILITLIERHRDAILQAWDDFASGLPQAVQFDREHLRNHIPPLLQQIVDIIRNEQLDRLGPRPAGYTDRDLCATIETAAQRHGSAWLDQGLTLDELIAEYGALRNSVLALWKTHGTAVDGSVLQQAIDFDTATDRTLAEAVSHYMACANHARELFLGILGHDMRSPLGAIRMSAQYLQESSAAGTDQNAAANRIVSSSARLQSMLDDLLDAARVRLNGRLPVDRRGMDAEETIAQVVDELRLQFPERSIVMLQQGDLHGEWDPVRVSQLASNLIANALAHGEPQAQVQVNLIGRPDAISLAIHNHGVPIPTQACARLFDPLVRLASTGERRRDGDGLGLGLYIARAIAEAHGGCIRVSSSANAGTTFTVELPRQRMDQPQRRQPG